LRITRGEGQELAIKIQAAVKSLFGHRWAGLTMFGVRPIPGRSESLSLVFGNSLPVEDVRAARTLQEAEPDLASPESASREDA
jgi:hypothetical protein